MRGLKKNQQIVFFKNVVDQEPFVDEYGNETGSYDPKYGEVKECYLCIAPEKGIKNFEPFGTLIDYDQIATTSDCNCEIDEQSVLWVERNIEEPYDYIVMRKATWKNSVAYAIKRVNVQNGVSVEDNE